MSQLRTLALPAIADKEVRSAARDVTTLGSLLNLRAAPGNQDQAATGSILLGEGLPPVPMEEVKRGDFVEMCELLPDPWLQTEDRETNIHSSRHRHVMV